MKALQSLRLKFQSGNDIPISRAMITREEYEEVTKVIGDAALAVSDRDEALSQKTLEAATLRKALAYVIKDLEIRAGTSGVVELGHGAYLQAKRALESGDESKPNNG